MNDELTPENLSEQREPARPDSAAESDVGARGGGGWGLRVFWCALLGALIGGLIGAARYEPDPDCYMLCFTRTDYVLFGAIAGVMIGTLAGVCLWLMWLLWPRRSRPPQD